MLDASGWSLQPMGRREIRVQLPDRQLASAFQSEENREGRDNVFRSVSTFKPLGLTPSEASSNQIVLVGRSPPPPPMSLGHTIFTRSCDEK